MQFSSVEKHFYNRQLEETLLAVGGMTAKGAELAGKGKRQYASRSLDVVSRHLQRLRAACCHPQVGSGGMGFSNTRKRATGADGSNSVSSKVLSMEQILDRLIEDARSKCEEALRLALFHSNPMASIARLKVEAKKDHSIAGISESDEFLLALSCKLYQDALDLADENATPSLAIGDALMSGCPGFQSAHKHLRGGCATLDWQIQHVSVDEQPPNMGQGRVPPIWANFEFQGRAKQLRQIRIRASSCIPENLRPKESDMHFWNLCYPKDCVLQASSAAFGGEFMDVVAFTLPRPDAATCHDDNWVTQGGLWIHRSKSWRLKINTYYTDNVSATNALYLKGTYVGIETELYEPTISSDSLQRLHTLHNAAISFRELHTVQSKGGGDSQERLPFQCLASDMQQRIETFLEGCDFIEKHHLEYAKGLQEESTRRLQALSSTRRKCEQDLLLLSDRQGKSLGFWDDLWWEDAVVAVKTQGSQAEQLSLCEKVVEIVDNFRQERLETLHDDKSNVLPAFHDLDGLLLALKLRFEKVRTDMGQGIHDRCVRTSLGLLPHPTAREISENQACQVCKGDWGRTGPKCGHCKLGDQLKALDLENQVFVRTLLDGMLKWLKINRSGVRSSRVVKSITARASAFFEVFEAARKEVLAASRLWRVHLDLLNILDELDSCKSTMRLVQDGEDISDFTEDQKNSLVVPIDVCTRYHEHAAKQAMALGDLRRQKDTLNFLKNQIQAEAQDEQGKDHSEEQSCPICLSAFDSDRAVLACGHSFHFSPCLEKLKKRSAGSNTIICPLRCKVRTKFDDVLIASNKSRDDGTQSRRKVKGNWGTKVTAIVEDLLNVSDKGQKSIVFSMWEDMLDIIEEALKANDLKFVRASSLRHIGDATRHFRSSDCFVLLLNVKNGAEGLTLVEASNVFMIEPLLNCGLDSQGKWSFFFFTFPFFISPTSLVFQGIL